MAALGWAGLDSLQMPTHARLSGTAPHGTAWHVTQQPTGRACDGSIGLSSKQTSGSWHSLLHGFRLLQGREREPALEQQVVTKEREHQRRIDSYLR